MRAIFFTAVSLLVYTGAFCQQRLPCSTITENMGYTIRSVKVQGRWLPADLKKQVAQATGEGQPLKKDNIEAGRALLDKVFTASENNFPIHLMGATSVLYIDDEICDVSDADHPKQVDVTIHVYYLRIDLYNVGNNVIPLPRSPTASLYRHVPASLLALAPMISFSTDRVRGTSLGLSTTTNLLGLSDLLKKKANQKKLSLDLLLDGQKSLEEKFYNLDGSLSLGKKNYTDSTIGWAVGFSFKGSRDPIAEGEKQGQELRGFGQIQGALRSSLFRKYALGVGYVSGKDSALFKGTSINKVKSNGVSTELMTDGRIGRGAFRTGIWFDEKMPEASSGLSNYQRLSGKIAYGIALGKGHNSVDLETTVGYGGSFGELPTYDAYYAGNTHWNFLYASFFSPSSTMLPDGALLRGLGDREGGIVGTNNVVSGATSYWHANLTFSIPIGRWSKPLVPDIELSDEPKVMLRKALKGATTTAKSFIASDLVDNHGYPPGDATDDFAEKLVDRDIKPTLDYLVDRANIYSVKPVVLFDVAGLHLRDTGSSTFISVGGGLQLTVVTASLQAGYAYTLRPSFYQGKGNFLLRLTIQNFF